MLAVVSAALGWCAPAQAQQAELDRDWQSSQLFTNRDDLWLRTSWAEVGPAGAVVLWNLGEGGYYDGGPLLAAFRARGEGLGPAQVLDTGPTERHAVAGSANGGALAVWFDFGTPVRFAELAPGARTFSEPKTLAEDARGYPSVAMNERGDAALLYRTEEGFWLRRRPAGGALGAAELVTADADGWLATLSVAADGAVVVGYQSRRQLVVRIGRGGQGLSPPYPVGSPQPPIDFAVGMDAGGNAVAAWVGDHDQVGTLRIAFKPRDAAGFGPPRETGVVTMGIDQRDLVVTAPGELIVALTTFEPWNGGANPTGAVAFFGDTRRELLGPVTQLSKDGYGEARVGANERGDAVVAYNIVKYGYGTRPYNLMFRRRAPHGSFGSASEHWPQPEIGPVYYREAEHPQLDSFGNAQALWWAHLDETGGAAHYDVRMAEDGPLLTQPPPPVGPSDGPLPPVLAPDPPPPAEPPAPASALARDRKAPVVRLRVERRIKHGRVRARVRCSERCALRIKVRVGRKALRVVAATAAARKERTLRLRVPRRGVLRLDLRARDAAGNVRRVKRAVRLRAAR